LVDAKFGCQLPQHIANPDRIIETAEECEKLGYDSVWTYDHLSPYWLHSGRALECWTLLSAVAARTSRIRIGSLVTNVNLRNPALLAKMTSTVDAISDGRLIVGLGTGDAMSMSEMRAYGYPFPSLSERVGRLRETILILKGMWTGQEVSLKGGTVQVSNAVSIPKPKQIPRPAIWVGGKHRMVLDVTAELADGWNYWGLNRGKLQELRSYLLKKCAELGRNPDEITKSWAGTISKATLTHSYPQMVQQIKTELLAQTDGETKYFIASFGSAASHDAYQAFAEAVKSIA
jgi:alkanesulfonate monooxygenase SsuD/methylene tetrahydromethanopterin reductase-like flavin-dependent oxidoreductase (luciferase family)